MTEYTYHNKHFPTFSESHDNTPGRCEMLFEIYPLPKFSFL